MRSYVVLVETFPTAQEIIVLADTDEEAIDLALGQASASSEDVASILRVREVFND
jgi:hypothetical protein